MADFHYRKTGKTHDLSAAKVKKHKHEFDAPGMQDGPCVVDGCNAYVTKSMEDNGKWTSEVKKSK